MKPRVIWLDDDIKKYKLKATVILFKKKFDLIECETIDEFYAKSKAYEWDAAILDVLNSDGRSGDIFKPSSTSQIYLRERNGSYSHVRIESPKKIALQMQMLYIFSNRTIVRLRFDFKFHETPMPSSPGSS